MTQYRRGYEFERKVSALFRKHGWFVVESRGSHGPADLVAANPYEVVLVQCKKAATCPPSRGPELEKLRVLGSQTQRTVAFAHPGPKRGDPPQVWYMPNWSMQAWHELAIGRWSAEPRA